MTEAPLLTVVVRSMARPSLAAALASIAAQDYHPVEVVVVAACGPSHPLLPATCGAHGLRLEAGPDRLLRAAAANAGLAAARGDWITFLDDDDVYLPGHLSALMAGRRVAPAAGVVYCYTRTRLGSGRTGRIGHPHALIELYDRNYIHLAAAIVAREVVAQGCRFGPAVDPLDDWDFFLQLAHRTPFHFVPSETFEWQADVGSSGVGLGANHDRPRLDELEAAVRAKWAAQRAQLVERVTPLAGEAQSAARRGDLVAAAECCRQALVASPNDPYVLNILAMVRMTEGELRAARAAQGLAVAIRPTDPGMVYNLAMVCRAQGDIATARHCCDRVLQLAPNFAQARRIRDELPAVAA
jgi:tetratricopeptide (TPR) repeat protein